MKSFAWTLAMAVAFQPLPAYALRQKEAAEVRGTLAGLEEALGAAKHKGIQPTADLIAELRDPEKSSIRNISADRQLNREIGRVDEILVQIRDQLDWAGYRRLRLEEWSQGAEADYQAMVSRGRSRRPGWSREQEISLKKQAEMSRLVVEGMSGLVSDFSDLVKGAASLLNQVSDQDRILAFGPRSDDLRARILQAEDSAGRQANFLVAFEVREEGESSFYLLEGLPAFLQSQSELGLMKALLANAGVELFFLSLWDRFSELSSVSDYLADSGTSREELFGVYQQLSHLIAEDIERFALGIRFTGEGGSLSDQFLEEYSPLDRAISRFIQGSVSAVESVAPEPIRSVPVEPPAGVAASTQPKGLTDPDVLDANVLERWRTEYNQSLWDQQAPAKGAAAGSILVNGAELFETYEAFRDNPGATQEEMGSRLGLGRVAISRRLGDLDTLLKLHGLPPLSRRGGPREPPPQQPTPAVPAPPVVTPEQPLAVEGVSPEVLDDLISDVRAQLSSPKWAGARNRELGPAGQNDVTRAQVVYRAVQAAHDSALLAERVDPNTGKPAPIQVQAADVWSYAIQFNIPIARAIGYEMLRVAWTSRRDSLVNWSNELVQEARKNGVPSISDEEIVRTLDRLMALMNFKSIGGVKGLRMGEQLLPIFWQFFRVEPSGTDRFQRTIDRFEQVVRQAVLDPPLRAQETGVQSYEFRLQKIASTLKRRSAPMDVPEALTLLGLSPPAAAPTPAPAPAPVPAQPAPIVAAPAQPIVLVTGWKQTGLKVRPLDRMAGFNSGRANHQQAHELYKAYQELLSEHNLTPPTEDQLFSVMARKRHLKSVWSSELQPQVVEIVRQILGSAPGLPLMLIRFSDPSPGLRRFLGAYLAQRVQDPAGLNQGQVWIPSGWNMTNLLSVIQSRDAQRSLEDLAASDEVFRKLLDRIRNASSSSTTYATVPATVPAKPAPPTKPVQVQPAPVPAPVTTPSAPVPSPAVPKPAPVAPAEPVQLVAASSYQTVDLQKTDQDLLLAASTDAWIVFSAYVNRLNDWDGVPPTEQQLLEHRDIPTDWNIQRLRAAVGQVRGILSQDDFPVLVLPNDVDPEVTAWMAAQIAEASQQRLAGLDKQQVVVPAGWDAPRAKAVLSQQKLQITQIVPSEAPGLRNRFAALLNAPLDAVRSPTRVEPVSAPVSATPLAVAETPIKVATPLVSVPLPAARKPAPVAPAEPAPSVSPVQVKLTAPEDSTIGRLERLFNRLELTGLQGQNPGDSSWTDFLEWLKDADDGIGVAATEIQAAVRRGGSPELEQVAARLETLHALLLQRELKNAYDRLGAQAIQMDYAQLEPTLLRSLPMDLLPDVFGEPMPPITPGDLRRLLGGSELLQQYNQDRKARGLPAMSFSNLGSRGSGRSHDEIRQEMLDRLRNEWQMPSLEGNFFKGILQEGILEPLGINIQDENVIRSYSNHPELLADKVNRAARKLKTTVVKSQGANGKKGTAHDGPQASQYSYEPVARHNEVVRAILGDFDLFQRYLQLPGGDREFLNEVNGRGRVLERALFPDEFREKQPVENDFKDIFSEIGYSAQLRGVQVWNPDKGQPIYKKFKGSSDLADLVRNSNISPARMQQLLPKFQKGSAVQEKLEKYIDTWVAQMLKDKKIDPQGVFRGGLEEPAEQARNLFEPEVDRFLAPENRQQLDLFLDPGQVDADLTRFYETLRPALERLGYRGDAWIARPAYLPAQPLAAAHTVYVHDDSAQRPWGAETVRSRLAQDAETGHFTLTRDPANSAIDIVIGGVGTPFDPLRQILIEVGSLPAAGLVTGRLLQYLESKELLQPGSILRIHEIRQGDLDEPVLIFA